MYKISPNEPCPCFSGKKYKKCCRPFHNSAANPQPVELVRARFAGFALGLVDFLIETTHPQSPHAMENLSHWQAQLQASCLRDNFTELEILRAEGDKVSYRARIISPSPQETHYIEHCTFNQIANRWYYFDGTMEDVPAT